ncbi:MAG: diaminopimelate decarboxylase, partial [Pseudomonadota bacterium]
MNAFHFKNGTLHAENIALDQIAKEVDTPCYVYSKSALTQSFNKFTAGLVGTNHLVCFAVKANPNIAIL